MGESAGPVVCVLQLRGESDGVGGDLLDLDELSLGMIGEGRTDGQLIAHLPPCTTTHSDGG